MRQHRKAIAAKHENDLRRIVEALRKHERQSEREMLNPGPKQHLGSAPSNSGQTSLPGPPRRSEIASMPSAARRGTLSLSFGKAKTSAESVRPMLRDIADVLHRIEAPVRDSTDGQCR